MMAGGGQGQGPGVFFLNKNAKRDVGRKAQLTNIQAGKTVASIVRTTLGPKAMLKMILDPMGGIVMTNDGNAILREVDVSHPAAKNMIELSRAQDEEVGDGTTSVIILAGEMLGVAEPLLEKKLHPTMIVSGYMQALDDALAIMKQVAYPVDTANTEAVRDIVRGAIDTKFSSRWGNLISDMAIKAVQTVCTIRDDGTKDIDVKRYAKVEKLSGGDLSECEVLTGVMFNKDVTHPKMRREILNPRVLLLDCPLEYKKGERVKQTSKSQRSLIGRNCCSRKKMRSRRSAMTSFA
jgi:T-complex protein 1 subunit gamma